MLDAPPEQGHQPIKSLTKAQRRALGVLIEKGFTTPDQYPLTLKGATSGCNQKNNRDPITNYAEDQVADAFSELRELGLAAVVHTESGRTERYRHWMRKRFEKMSEGQLAILGELLLRGRQQVGELRARASRMSPIDSLEQLRKELDGLIAEGFVQSDGPLDRRGAEVDHNWYEPREGMALHARPPEPETPRPMAPAPASSFTATAAPQPAARSESAELAQKLKSLEATCEELRSANTLLIAEVSDLRERFERLTGDFDRLRSDLGG